MAKPKTAPAQILVSGENTNYHELDSESVLKKFNTTPSGLSSEQARDRLAKYGPNDIVSEKKINPLSIFLGQFKNTLVIILIFATIFSAVIGELVDAIAILVIVVLNAIFGFVQEYKAEKTIEALKRMTSPESVVIRNGKQAKVLSKDLVPGDIVLLDEGTRVPADIRLIEVAELKIDEAIITGESLPVHKETCTFKSSVLAERKNICFMGTMVCSGRGKGVVVSTGMNTEMGKIAHTIGETVDEQTPLQKKLESFGRKLGLIVLGICAAVSIIGILKGSILVGSPITEKLITIQIINGIALAVAAVPEGLPAIVTVTLALGLRRLAKKNALMRRLPTVETLGSTTVICSDKTGTLTKNEMTIQRVWYPDRELSVTGTGYERKGEFLSDGQKVDPKKDKQLLALIRAGALCNNSSLEAKDGEWRAIGDPTEAAILVASYKAGFGQEDLEHEYPRLREFPFSSERKMMSTVNHFGKETFVSAKGAPEVVLKRCTHIMIDGKVRLLTNHDEKMVLEKNREFATSALRVIGIAYKDVRTVPVKEKDAESGLTFLGLVGMIDPPRESVKHDVETCKKAGITVVMITGDHADTAVAIAKQIGITDNDNVITGHELDTYSDEQLKEKAKETFVYARVNPEHKARIVDALKANGHVIAMTGDGVNDAPALKKADIGIAMGIKGTDVAKEASDMVLRDDNFSSIVAAVKEGRGIYDNIKKFIQYLLSSNTGEVLIVFIATMLSLVDPETGLILMPLQLLWVNILTDGMPALALGVDPPSPGIMERPPRDPKENILTKSMLIDIFIVGAIMAAGTLFLFWYNLPTGGRHAMTVAFTSIVVFEMVRIQSVRAEYHTPLLSNKALIAAMALSVILQIVVVYTPFFNDIFNTTPLGLEDWGEILLVSGVMVVVMKIRHRAKRAANKTAKTTVSVAMITSKAAAKAPRAVKRAPRFVKKKILRRPNHR